MFDSHFNGSLLLINDETEMDTHMYTRKMSIVVHSICGKHVCVCEANGKSTFIKNQTTAEVSFVLLALFNYQMGLVENMQHKFAYCVHIMCVCVCVRHSLKIYVEVM